ncbi:MAG: hypothetical protein JNL01_15825 [Bdellovibrionales bacterium]|nr:hypothetical protein [Bdellovibrionales bacterium]
MSGSDTIQFQEIVAIGRRHMIKAAICVVVGTLAGFGSTYLFEKRYQSRAVLNIPAAYFQVPLVGDLVPAAHDPNEYRSQREALLRVALSNEFLEELGEKFGYFLYPKGDPYRTVEREYLLKRIEYVGIGSNNYMISVGARTAENSYNLTKMVLERMISTLVEERLARLTRARTAIQNNLNQLKMEMSRSGLSKAANSNDAPESLEVEEARLMSLQNQYTEQHPNVVRQKQKVERLRAEKASADRKERASAKTKVPGENSISGSHRALLDMHDELLKKLNLLNIVIDMEKSMETYTYLPVIEDPSIPAIATFPKKRVFAGIGFALGLVLAVLLILFLELKKGTFANPTIATQVFDAPFLGSLPSWQFKGTGTLLLPKKEK